MTRLLQKIRSSLTTQLTLWVAGVVIVISGVVIILMTRFTQEVINEETIETTQQALKNTAMKLNNTIRQAEMTAKLENETFIGDKSFIEKLIKNNNYLVTLNQTYPDATFQVTDQPSKPGESGYMKVIINGEPNYFFYEPVYIRDKAYGISLYIPVEVIFGQYAMLRFILLIAGIIGIIILIFICWKIIAWHLYPLHLLADSAQSIADGNLNESIPDSKQQSEIGKLQSSLSKMQRSLAIYMEEMKQKNALLSNQNNQLQEAYSKAQEYENLKSMFVHQMTKQITMPVDTISRNTATICTDYHQLTEKDMNNIHEEITDATENITQLLDQLLNTPVQKRPNMVT